MSFRLFVLTLFLVCAALAADISGTWNFTVETDQGSGNPTFVFNQDGEKLTGTYTGRFGTSKLTGTVKGDHLDFTFDVSGEPSGTMHYKGSVDSPTSMKGDMEFADLGKGTWTATKK